MRGRPLTKRYKPPVKPPLQVVSLGPKHAVALSNGKYLDVSGPTALRMKKNFVLSITSTLCNTKIVSFPPALILLLLFVCFFFKTNL